MLFIHLREEKKIISPHRCFRKLFRMLIIAFLPYLYVYLQLYEAPTYYKLYGGYKDVRKANIVIDLTRISVLEVAPYVRQLPPHSLMCVFT